MSEVSFRRLDRDAVVQRLRRYAEEELGARPEVLKVVLVGSLSREDWSARSDADLVVLVDRADEPVAPFRAPDYLPTRSLGVPIDVFVHTLDEAEAWGAGRRAEVERGVVLYERPSKGSLRGLA